MQSRDFVSRRYVLQRMALGAVACAAPNALADSLKDIGYGRFRNGLPHASPESLGIDPSVILAFANAADQKLDSLHSFVLVRHGRIAAEAGWSPYSPSLPHMLFSLSKSFTSTAVGLAVSEGRLSIEAPLLSFFPEYAPSKASRNLEDMRIRHLLTMMTGHAKDTTDAITSAADGNWVKTFLAQPVEHQPGTHFVYNSGASYMLSATVQKVTGQRVRDYLQSRLFGPLGIKGAPWDTCPRGINTGGWGLSISAEDIARFGQLYLKKGVWNGRRLLPDQWVYEATLKQVSNAPNANPDWEQGYGYQFWQCRHGAFRGDGAFGQFCIVMPEQDAVLAITSGLGDMQAVLNLVWEHLLPGMKADSLPGGEDTSLKPKLAALAMAPQKGTASGAKGVSGRTYTFPKNDAGIQTMSFRFEDDQSVMTIRNDKGEHRVVCGNGVFVKGVNDLFGEKQKVAGSGAWTSDDTYVMKLCFYETPFCDTITCRFEGNQLHYGFKSNVGFGPNERPELIGQAA